MVFDSIKNANKYYGLGTKIKTALEYFENYDADKHETTRLDIDGNLIFVLRLSYTTAKSENSLLEAHKDYIDVMYIAGGEERFFVKPLERVEEITKVYDPSIEACLAKIDADCASFRFSKGYFCIFFPEDAHCAGQIFDTPSNVKKLIAKVRVD